MTEVEKHMNGHGGLTWANIIALGTLGFGIIVATVSAAFYLNRETAKDNANAISSVRREAYLRSLLVWEVTNERINSLRELEGHPRIETDPLPEPN